MKEQLLTYMVGWMLLALATIVIYNFRIKYSVGLVSALISCSFIEYFSGAFVHVLPWWFSENTFFTFVGFRQVFIGLVGFFVGSAVIAPFFLKVRSLKKRQVLLNPRLAIAGIFFGLLFYLKFPFSEIPTIRVIPIVSWSFMVCSVCLLGYLGYYLNNFRLFLFSLILALFFPIYSIFNLGFLGYGALAFVVIIIFISVFFRPRVVMVIFTIVVVYLGLSLYVTYMRDRDIIRSEVWYKQDTGYGGIKGLFKDFEFFDPHNQKHLISIEGRLNQASLVGMVVYNLEQGYQKFAQGELFFSSLFSIIPRIIWPEKPFFAGESTLVSKYTGLTFAYGTSVGTGLVMEFFIDYGSPFVFLGYLILGLLLAIFDVKARISLENGDWKKFYLYFLLGINMLGSLATERELIMTVGSVVIFYFVIIKFVFPRLVKLKNQFISSKNK